MAYDKVVDSAVLDANLTTVADAIRAKGGTTGALSFPAGFADAIAAIQAGGGGGGGGEESFLGYYCKTGSFTPSETVNVSTFSLDIPCEEWFEKTSGYIYETEVCVLLVREYINQKNESGFLMHLILPAKKGYVNTAQYQVAWYGTMESALTVSSFGGQISVNKSKKIITYSMIENTSSECNRFLAGVTYRYICAVFNDSLKVGG
jgi:hypothetical protein